MTRSLRHRNYRLFFYGQSVSLIGTWLTRTATGWLVFQLSGSAVSLGLVNFASLIPIFLLTPFAGVLADRWNRHRVLIATQVLAAIQSALLAILTLTGHITVNLVIILSVFQGLINAFDFPVRQSFVTQMIDDRKDLPSAIAINSSMVNMARLIGPSMAGYLIAMVGLGGCFSIDAVSYIAVIATLCMMKVRALPPHEGPQKNVLQDLGEGLAYARKSPKIVSTLSLLGLICFVGVPYSTLLPLIVGHQLNGDVRLYGYLSAAAGLGALVGAVTLGSLKNNKSLPKLASVAALVFGVGLILFSLSHTALLSVAIMPLVGLGMMMTMAVSNTILQTTVEESMRGRIMSLFAVAYAGTTPFGSLLGGFLAEHIGAPSTIAWGGSICCLGAIVYSRFIPKLQTRPIAIALETT